jgi:hypothetical protein
MEKGRSVFIRAIGAVDYERAVVVRGIVTCSVGAPNVDKELRKNDSILKQVT